MYIELNLPEQQYGDWTLDSFHKNGKQYQQLHKGNLLMMANTPEITADYVEFLHAAQGAIHINGLGIGLCCQYLLAKPEVTKLVVLETEPAILRLVAPYFQNDPRCTILQADAYTYEPPKGAIYDFVWHDIWTYKAALNVAQMEGLFARYAPYAKWQGAWSQAACRQLKQKEEQSILLSQV